MPSPNAARREAVAQAVERMTTMMENIAKIVESISDFARQTTLSALNATIEAARAQESGKGFALIAQEIRKLATSAAGATGEIENRVVLLSNPATNHAA